MKPDRLPEFAEGVHYRQLEPRKEGRRRWRFTTARGVRLPLRNLSGPTVLYHGADGRVWAKHDQFGIYVAEGYAWNGCSPKRWVWPFGWMGTPDFQATILAGLFHDVHYQFSATEHFPLHKSDVDAMFYHCIAMAGDEPLAGVHHAAVRRYGKWSGKVEDGEFSTAF